jgi:hypothetical protein
VLISYLSLSSFPHLQLESAWCLANIASGTSAQTKEILDNNALPKLLELLESRISMVVE